MATTDLSQPIRDWYHTCIETYEKIGTEIDNLAPGQKYGESLFALQHVQHGNKHFRQWAEDMGVDPPVSGCRMSLDDQLSMTPPIHQNVVGLLEELNTSLLEMLLDVQNSLKDPASTDNVLGSGSVASKSNSNPPVTEYMLKTLDISGIITCLYLLGTRPRPQRDRLAEMLLNSYQMPNSDTDGSIMKKLKKGLTAWQLQLVKAQESLSQWLKRQQ